MKITLIVCTRNRASQLTATLQKLSKLKTKEPWVIILVNNGSDDSNQEILENFCAIDTVHRKVFHEPKLGVSNAQNTGIKHVTGEIIAVSDDEATQNLTILIGSERDLFFVESPIDYLGGRVLLFDPEDAPVTIQTCINSIVVVIERQKI